MTCRTDDAMWYTSADVKDPFFMPEPLTSEFKSSPIPEQLKNGISCIRKDNQTMLFSAMPLFKPAICVSSRTN